MNDMLGVFIIYQMGVKYITLIWGADLYAILIQTLQDFVIPHPDYQDI